MAVDRNNNKVTTNFNITSNTKEIAVGNLFFIYKTRKHKGNTYDIRFQKF